MFATSNLYINEEDESLIQCVHLPGIAAPVAWCSGYCLMVRRTALEEIEERLEAIKNAVQEKKDEVRTAYEAGKEAYQKEKAKHGA